MTLLLTPLTVTHQVVFAVTWQKFSLVVTQRLRVFIEVTGLESFILFSSTCESQ